MKLNMLIGKKQIILASLVVILSIAVYLNWQYSATGENGLNLVEQTEKDTSEKNYGDVQQVDNNGGDYFAEASLQKEQSRGEAIETLNNLLNDAELTQEEKDSALTQATQIMEQIDAENTMENLILAKGFEKCVVYYNGDTANIVVKSSELSAEQAAQIKDIVVEQTSLEAEYITIIERN